MKGFPEKVVTSNFCLKTPTESSTTALTSDCPEQRPSDSKLERASLWSSFFSSAFSVFESYRESSTCEKKGVHSRSNGWTSAVKKVVAGGSMRRLHERVLGPTKIGIPAQTSDIWLLGTCYKISADVCPAEAATSNIIAEFTHDFSSRILVTYRKGFDAIGDSKFTSDVGWGCMVRSSQMLIAQALLCHQFGRSWRRMSVKPQDQDYITILHLFGDSEASPFSIHNLLLAGKAYGLAAGSWVGPYAMCRSWEALVRSKRGETALEFCQFPMALYVVSGDENGERGGAPVVCIEDVHRSCLEFSKGQADWTPVILLVPLVLGLDKVNPRYIPSLQATFTFPQSLGILGGKPGASTYMVGVQDDNAFYLDPHEVQQVVNISKDDLEADASSYHSNVIRHIPLESIDPSLAIGFYCRDKDDFDEFCSLSSKLAEASNGAPLFTVAHSHKNTFVTSSSSDAYREEHHDDNSADEGHDGDEWQLL